MSQIKRLAMMIALGAALGACQKADAPASGADAAPIAQITLKPEGEELKPPVQKAAIPEGGWYCDMGTVHYARSEKGDGKCPLCHMPLTEKHDH